jgi:hypothetical protein
MNISNKIVSSFLEPVGFSANYLLVNNKKALHFAVNLPFILFLLLMLIGQIVMVSHLKDENGLYLYDSKYWEMARKIPLVLVEFIWLFCLIQFALSVSIIHLLQRNMWDFFITLPIWIMALFPWWMRSFYLTLN